MTTTVRVLIEGNQQCEVIVIGPGVDTTPTPPVEPGQWTTRMIHGQQMVTVREIQETAP